MLAAALLAGSLPAAATTPTRDWANVRQLVVICRAVAETPDAALRLRDALSGSVAAGAARGAPVPVVVVSFGDAAMFAPGSIVLLVNARAETANGERLLSLGMRAWRPALGEDDDPFGAPPRAVRIAEDGAGPALDAAIDAALAGVLPWRRIDLTRN